MQSPTNRIKQTFSSLLPIINKNKFGSSHNRNFDLNNQGCKCQLCQKIISTQNMKITKQQINDLESQQFQHKNKENYIAIIQQMSNLWKYRRGLRFYLPEICQYQHAHPVALIQKKKQNGNITVHKSKSKLHVFEIQSFFLNGFITHSLVKKQRTTKTEAISKAYLNECIIFAKYVNNTYRMLTYQQIQSMFRSKNRSMKDNLMYIQTIVGGDSFKYTTIIVRLEQISGNQQMNLLWQRAKVQVKIISGQYKLTDPQYFSQQQQIQFENQLKQLDINRYLLYLSFKIILISSKANNRNTIIKNCIFKYAIVDKKVYLFDLRVIQFAQSQTYWSSNVLQALQIKLKKTMTMMQLDNPQKQVKYKLFQNQLSNKARQLSEWLKSSTQQEWQQMRIIRQRLQKLQQQKKSLQKSQNQQSMRKTFKVRHVQAKKQRQRGESKVNMSLNF